MEGRQKRRPCIHVINNMETPLNVPAAMKLLIKKYCISGKLIPRGKTFIVQGDSGGRIPRFVDLDLGISPG